MTTKKLSPTVFKSGKTTANMLFQVRQAKNRGGSCGDLLSSPTLPESELAMKSCSPALLMVLWCSTILAEEAATPGFGQPRRHVAARRDFSDLARALPRVGIAEQGKRSGAAWMVAGCAMLEQDRRDITRKRGMGRA